MNLVLPVATTASVQVSKLFNNLEELYNLCKKSEKIHGLFESSQIDMNCAVLSVKRINKVLWDAWEFSLHTCIERYVSIVSVLEKNLKIQLLSVIKGIWLRVYSILSNKAILFKELF